MKKNELIPLCLVVLLYCCCLACGKDSPVENPPDPAAITTTAPHSITYNTAVSGGTIADQGTEPITERGICYHTAPAPTIQNQLVVNGSGGGSFSSAMSNLSPNVIYYVKAYAKNKFGVSYGKEVSFKTNEKQTDIAGTIFVSSYKKKLFALRAADGMQKWVVDLPDAVIESPIYSNGKVFIPCSKKMYAYDTLGSLKWSVDLQNEINPNSPVINDGLLYVPTMFGLEVFNADNGAVVWRHTEPGGGSGNTPISFVGNTLYYNHMNIYALDKKTGIKKWSHQLGEGTRPPVILNNKIFTFAANHTLCALDQATGNQLWKKPDYYLGLGDILSLNAGNGKLYAVADRKLYVLDSANANILAYDATSNYEMGMGDGIFPVLTDSVALVPGFKISVHDAITGVLKYTLPTEQGGTSSAPTVVGNIVYYTIRETEFPVPGNVGASYFAGFIVAYDLSSRQIKWKKEFKNMDFLWTSPAVVTETGKSIRGSAVYN